MADIKLQQPVYFMWLQSSKNHPNRSKLIRWQSVTDFVLGSHEVVIEVKAADNAQPRHMKGLKHFADEYVTKKLILVTRDPYPRKVDNILILPWNIFIQKLWSGEII